MESNFENGANKKTDTITSGEASEPFKYAGRMLCPEGSIVDAGGIKIGGRKLQVIVSAASLKSASQAVATAHIIKSGGAAMFSCRELKPIPYMSPDQVEREMSWLLDAKEATGIPLITEVTAMRNIKDLAGQADILQVNGRDMQNFELLKALGKVGRPVILKRGSGATIEEWILAAEYIMAGGNANVILCAGVIESFEKYTDNRTLDLSAVPAAKMLSHLPVIIDLRPAVGDSGMIASMAKAAVAAGADGLILEVGNASEKALTEKEFLKLMDELRAIAGSIGREM